MKYGLRVEFCTRSIKYNADILNEMDIPAKFQAKIGSINSNLLIDEKDPLALFRQKFKKTFSSFIFVHDHLDPLEVFEALSFMLQPGAYFAVFSTFLQPLSNMQNALEQDGKKAVINLKLEELFTREAQVLPLRTHPHMNMHGKSGYILSGIKLA